MDKFDTSSLQQVQVDTKAIRWQVSNPYFNGQVFKGEVYPLKRLSIKLGIR